MIVVPWNSRIPLSPSGDRGMRAPCNDGRLGLEGTHGEHGQAPDQEPQVPALPERGAGCGPPGHARTLPRPLQRGPQRAAACQGAGNRPSAAKRAGCRVAWPRSRRLQATVCSRSAEMPRLGVPQRDAFNSQVRQISSTGVAAATLRLQRSRALIWLRRRSATRASESGTLPAIECHISRLHVREADQPSVDLNRIGALFLTPPERPRKDS